MATTRNIFFGSLFEFSDAGVEEVLESLRDQFADPEIMPFISYDKNNNVFACEVESTDHDTISMIATQIETYITLHCRKPNEPLESDRLRPIEGTTIKDEVLDTKARDTEPNLLFDIGDSSSDEDDKIFDEQNAIHWTPKCGDLSILSRELASDIADSTGCFFIPDQAGRKIQLVHGNLQLALQKLERLEDVLTLVASHRSPLTSCADSNILLSSNGPESAIKFVRPVQPLCGFDRILLNPEQVPLSNQITLGEARVWRDEHHVKPINLDLEQVSITAYHGLPLVFRDVSPPTFGDAKNAEPRPPSNENSQMSGEIQRAGSPTKFLGHKETERVETWRGNIDPEATPNLPPPEPAPEEEQKLSRRRVKEEESSDEDENVVSPENTVAIQQKPALKTKQIAVETAHSSGSDSLGPGYDKRSIPEDAHSRACVTASKRAVHSAPAKTALKSSNIFEFLDDDDDDATGQQESTSEEPISDQSSSRVKQLNVTFEEPETKFDGSVVADMSPTKSLSGKLVSPHVSTSNYALRKHMSKSVHVSPQKSTLRSPEKNHVSYPNLSARSPSFVPIRPAPVFSHGQGSHSRRESNQTNEQNYVKRSQQNLIDITLGDSLSEPIAPPPGFDYRSTMPAGFKGSAVSPHQEVNGRRAMYSSPTTTKQSTTSHNSPVRSSQHPSHLDFTPQFTVPKRNMSYLKNQALTQLERQIGTADTNDEETKNDENTLPPNRIQKDDEFSTRKYHKTMGQKMGKPGKKEKNSSSKETKAEREARIAKAKSEAYGDVKMTKVPSGKSQLEQRPVMNEDMSAKKRQLLKKNQAMGYLHQDALASSFSQDAAAKLVEDLKPILRAARAFKGVIKVEVQLGQALILQSSRLDVARLYRTKEWAQLFGSNSQTNPKVTFTNLITTNGLDIDRVLEMKADAKVGAGLSKMWDKIPSTLPSTLFEFVCQDKTGEDFLLLLNQDGKHSLNRSESIIGQIVLHSPDQIWDACTVVSGAMTMLRPSEDLTAGVKQFIENLYIPGGQKAAVYFRLPSNNSFTIRAITVKRASCHRCLLPDRENLELRLTEVKTLSHSANPTDKKLYRSYESSYEVMVNENRIHYELAVADKSIESVFSANPDIEVGESALNTTPNKALINFSQARDLIETTSEMLKNIDWVGASNIGTLRRIFDNVVDQRATIVSALPPNLNRSLAIPMGTTAPPNNSPPPTAHQSQNSRIETGGNTTVPEPVLRQLYGVRTNTAAELYQDPSSGELFYYGQGGARIPVVNEQLEGPKIDGLGPVLPGDSASQIGGDVRRMMVGTSKKEWDDKPAGFW